MTKIKLLFLLFSLAMLTSCEFIKDSFTFKDKTEQFVESLMKRDYDKCFSQMAFESKLVSNANIDTIKASLENIRSAVERDFGNNGFKYTLMQSRKKRSTIESENTPPNTTLAFVEFSNEKEFGVFEVLFDDNSKKILSFQKLDVKAPIPNMILFWLFGIVPLAVLVFNIYVIRKIKRSTLSKKWLRYITVLIFNVPAISYAAVAGLSFKLLNFQFLFGISFSAMGYLGSVWTFGIPLGGIYWLWKLKQRKETEVFDAEIESSYIEKQPG